MSLTRPRILVAGIGNVFLGDDGFGVETVRRLAARPLSDDISVVDYGIRGLDLTYALLEPHDAVIIVDLVARGEAPGTLFLIQLEIDAGAPVTLDAHGMDPVKVLALARSMGAPAADTFLVACEPAFVPPPDCEDVVMELSAPVAAAVDEAVRMVETLIARIGAAGSGGIELQNLEGGEPQ
jgi:hydrogenase maturation protease